MEIKTLQNEILRLKNEKDFCILAHSYMSPEILEIADYTGDSFKLSVDGTKVKNQNLLICGVRFMAETAKLLSPEKRIFLSNLEAGCPMAEQLLAEQIKRFKEENPDYVVVAYVNTTTQLKALADVCVTSSSALKIVSALKEKNILFIPDRNLGSYVAERLPDKNIRLLDGYCPVHDKISENEVLHALKLHPKAQLLIHPECKKEVVKYASYVGATSGIINYAISSDNEEFIIGTENSVLQYLELCCPEKRFYPLSKHLICPDMKLTTLKGIYNILLGADENEILLDDEILKKAKNAVDKMIALN